MNSEEVIYQQAFFFSIGFGCYYRTIRDKNLKKNVGTCVGLAMTLIVSGVHSLHFLLTVFVNMMIISKIDKKRCHIVSFAFSFLYLTFYRSTTYFGIPYPPAHTDFMQMLFTLKLVGLAFEVNSSQIDLRKSQDENDQDAVTKIEVNCIDIFHYSFNYIGVLAGPYYKYSTFVDYFNYPFAEHAEWKRAALNKLKYAPLYLMLFLVVGYLWPVSYVSTEEFYQRSWLYRYWYMWPMVIDFEMRLFLGLLLTNVACIIAGFGAYPSFTNPKPGQGPSDKFADMKQLLSNEAKLSTVEYSFETISSINVYQVEFGMKIRDMTQNWNCCTQYWLVTNIYRRFPYKKYRTAVTFLISGVWHGTYIGYYLSLGLTPFFLVIEDIFLKLYVKDTEGKFLKIYQWIHWCYKIHYSTYLIVAFVLLRFDLVLNYYNSIYHVGAVSGVILYFIGLFILKVKATKEKKIVKRLNWKVLF